MRAASGRAVSRTPHEPPLLACLLVHSASAALPRAHPRPPPCQPPPAGSGPRSASCKQEKAGSHSYWQRSAAGGGGGGRVKRAPRPLALNRGTFRAHLTVPWRVEEPASRIVTATAGAAVPLSVACACTRCVRREARGAQGRTANARRQAEEDAMGEVERENTPTVSRERLAGPGRRVGGWRVPEQRATAPGAPCWPHSPSSSAPTCDVAAEVGRSRWRGGGPDCMKQQAAMQSPAEMKCCTRACGWKKGRWASRYSCVRAAVPDWLAPPRFLPTSRTLNKFEKKHQEQRTSNTSNDTKPNRAGAASREGLGCRAAPAPGCARLPPPLHSRLFFPSVDAYRRS